MNWMFLSSHLLANYYDEWNQHRKNHTESVSGKVNFSKLFGTISFDHPCFVVNGLSDSATFRFAKAFYNIDTCFLPVSIFCIMRRTFMRAEKASSSTESICQLWNAFCGAEHF